MLLFELPRWWKQCRLGPTFLLDTAGQFANCKSEQIQSKQHKSSRFQRDSTEGICFQTRAMHGAYVYMTSVASLDPTALPSQALAQILL